MKQSKNQGECCTCSEGFIGNGKYCLADATPITVNGKISGYLNHEKLNDLDLYAYVLTQASDSRNFVVIRKIPLNQGGSLQTLISLINPIGWLFSGFSGHSENTKISNGFTLTGNNSY